MLEMTILNRECVVGVPRRMKKVKSERVDRSKKERKGRPLANGFF